MCEDGVLILLIEHLLGASSELLCMIIDTRGNGPIVGQTGSHTPPAASAKSWISNARSPKNQGRGIMSPAQDKRFSAAMLHEEPLLAPVRGAQNASGSHGHGMGHPGLSS